MNRRTFFALFAAPVLAPLLPKPKPEPLQWRRVSQTIHFKTDGRMSYDGVNWFLNRYYPKPVMYVIPKRPEDATAASALEDMLNEELWP